MLNSIFNYVLTRGIIWITLLQVRINIPVHFFPSNLLYKTSQVLFPQNVLFEIFGLLIVVAYRIPLTSIINILALGVVVYIRVMKIACLSNHQIKKKLHLFLVSKSVKNGIRTNFLSLMILLLMILIDTVYYFVIFLTIYDNSKPKVNEISAILFVNELLVWIL